MSNFRTSVKFESGGLEINHLGSIMSIGSCFAESVGQHLRDAKFNISINPFGILYNPISISNCINRLLDDTEFTEEELIQYNELWHSFSHHGKFSGLDKKEVLNNINDAYKLARQSLLEANVLTITLGTAQIYEYKESKSVVANCHKLPNHLFKTRLIDVKEAADSLSKAIEELRRVNPNVKVLFTISPVRYMKESAVKNTKSKSILVLAIHQLLEQIEEIYYFPAYEILMDDLRDYRFYKEDMIHPSSQAVEYIWLQFKSRYFNTDTVKTMEDLHKVIRAMLHKPFNPNSENHHRFLKEHYQKVSALQVKYPYISLEKELKYFG